MTSALRLAVPLAASALAACGGSGGGGGTPCSATVTIAITVPASNPPPFIATPASPRLCLGGQVTFRNDTAGPIQVDSAPHPTHGSCPAIDMSAPLDPGGTFSATLPTEATCSYHEHLSNGTALGTITVAAAPQPGGGGGGY